MAAGLETSGVSVIPPVLNIALERTRPQAGVFFVRVVVGCAPPLTISVNFQPIPTFRCPCRPEIAESYLQAIDYKEEPFFRNGLTYVTAFACPTARFYINGFCRQER